MKVYIGADHRGFHLKELLIPYITSLGHTVVDVSESIPNPVDDFPDISFAVATLVVAHHHDDPPNADAYGIVICGSGGGVTIAANKIPGIRCVQGFTSADVVHNRNHNNVNMLSLGSDITDEKTAGELVRLFLSTPFGNEERFIRRLAKIHAKE